MEPLRLCVLISGSGSNLQSIINAIEKQELSAQIVRVISNNPQAYGLQRATSHGIPVSVVDHHDFPQRRNYDLALREVIDALPVDLIVLAGFMRILDSDFIQAYERKIVNIHPSLLPKYKGLNTHQRVLDNADTEHGVSIHLVTAELDDGPLLMQSRYPVTSEDNLETLQTRGHALEHQMYPRLLQWIASGALQINDESIFFNEQPLQQPLTLSDA